MSNDALCVGVCMIDWDTGVCLGCGRTSDEINGVPVAEPPPAEMPRPQQSAVAAPLPPNVADALGEGSD
ncbi:DUF1289 domain-containing protein [Thauera sp. CAU 1555]|jgi:hypothetical protein|uniref:DUF1289 domain-containing protein n=1 Tax=Thauera sedimentorum TaxID=2767595 RepID=A0ABR9BAD1_9RHOO|nr:DUF1289 domain-containing protein [Thauera sedimentorum]MBC9072389.1 DUF1289 domain-containing protein [Thauera sedimentorum]MBD8503308.1 DUF1289 domain-containing protein [Thauera sedimentorum]